jgi:formamidopyrimidine-DNA glycosylase
MPELPEVETIARTLRSHVVDAAISDARVLRASSLHRLSEPVEKLRGCRIAAVSRRGKLLLFSLDCSKAEDAVIRHRQDLLLLIHLRMTGRLLVHAKPHRPTAYTRCIFDLCKPDGTEYHLFFDDIRAFGLIFVASPASLQQWPFWRQLGPEPLTLAAQDFAERIMSRKAGLKSVLLDQKTLAGIGNIYADESLFAAGLDPRRKANTLSQEQCLHLLQKLKAILEKSIAECGSSIRDYRDANGNVGAFQNNFMVYGRAGQACRICRTKLEKTKVAGRGTVYCPSCQK